MQDPLENFKMDVVSSSSFIDLDEVKENNGNKKRKNTIKKKN